MARPKTYMTEEWREIMTSIVKSKHKADVEKISVSIIVPVYNTEMYLTECVKSIIGQTYQNWEIILIEDGSTDSSGTLCDYWSNVDERIYVIHQENQGLAAARNAGLRHCNGDYILFLDSDDYYASRSFLEHGVNKLCERDYDVVLFGYSKYYEVSQKSVSRPVKVKTKNLSGFMESDFSHLVGTFAYNTGAWSKFVKRSLILENSLFFKEGRLSEDVDWSGKLAICSRQIGVLDEIGVIYRQRENSITKSVNENHIYDLEKAIAYCIEALPETVTMKFRRAYYSYIGWQVCNYVLSLSTLDKVIQKRHYSEVEKYSEFIKYNKSIRGYVIRGLLCILGKKCTFCLLRSLMERRANV